MNSLDPQQTLGRLLIVDNDQAQMKALCETLGNHGYETAGFTSASAALAALHESKFDLILSALTMPEMNGISLVKSAIDVDPDLVGVIMTGQAMIETAVEAMKSVPLDIILKPFDPGVGLGILSRALAIRRLRMENAELQRRVQRHADELQKANQDFESFTHSVSHDLRAPLRAIGGFSKILLKDFGPQLPEEAQRLIHIVVSSGAQMTQMIDALLKFCRLGRQALIREPVNLTALARQTVDDLERDQKGRSIEVKIAKLPDCVGDPALLNQVFANLLSNAFKFTSRAENPVIEIGCEQRNAENIYFVRDNGIGFEMQYAERLFGIFQRLHAEGEFEGNGVGLSIVQRIIERHGGRIWAKAEPDKGATFFFTLPNSR